jgi:hypothetical protein
VKDYATRAYNDIAANARAGDSPFRSLALLTGARDLASRRNPYPIEPRATCVFSSVKTDTHRGNRAASRHP